MICLSGSPTNLFARRLLMTGDPNVKVPIIMNMLFPQEWLAEKATDDPEGRTNLEVQSTVSALMNMGISD